MTQSFSELDAAQFLRGLLLALRAGGTTELSFQDGTQMFEAAVFEAYDYLKGCVLRERGEIPEADILASAAAGSAAVSRALEELRRAEMNLQINSRAYTGIQIAWTEEEAGIQIAELPGSPELWDKVAGVFLRDYNRLTAA